MSDVPTDLPANDVKQDVKQEASKLEALAHRLLCADPDDSDTSEFDQQLKNIRDKGKDFATRCSNKRSKMTPPERIWTVTTGAI